MSKEQQKEKFRVAPPYADRKPPRGMEFEQEVSTCRRCMRTRTWIETDTGSMKLWCIHCEGATGDSI